MSSSYVRTELKNFITASIPSEDKVVDLTGEYDNLRKVLAKNSINHTDNWLGLQFIANDEEVVTLSAGNNAGKYREFGALYLHVVSPAQIGVADVILPRTEIIRNTFRGQRIGDILIQSVTPPNFESGATLQFEGGYQSASVIVTYERDLNL